MTATNQAVLDNGLKAALGSAKVEGVCRVSAPASLPFEKVKPIKIMELIDIVNKELGKDGVAFYNKVKADLRCNDELNPRIVEATSESVTPITKMSRTLAVTKTEVDTRVQVSKSLGKKRVVKAAKKAAADGKKEPELDVFKKMFGSMPAEMQAKFLKDINPGKKARKMQKI